MRWLVTGGLGFVGSEFVRLVLRERPQCHVVNLDATTYAGNPENLRGVVPHPRYDFIRGSIYDARDIERAIGRGVDAIVNFAAETHVDRSIAEPEEFVRTNVMGTHMLLEAQRRFNVQRYLQVSSDEVYGEVLQGNADESAPLRPRSPYSASKAAADLEVLAYHTTFGSPVLITRGSNTYGPRQYPEKLIPLFITNLIDGEPVPIYGDGMQVRDWLHVEDHARGILGVLERGTPGEVYNLGGGNERTNLEMARVLMRECGRAFETHARHVTDRKGHDKRYAVSTAKARGLGWEPQVALDEGLRAAVAWYRHNEWWWRPLKSGAFRDYYRQQYPALSVRSNR